MGKFQTAGLMVGDRLKVADVIENDGEALIVVLWFSNPSAGLRRPEYVLPLKSVRYLENTTDPHRPRYLVDGVFPASLFAGTASRNERRQFGVCKGPKIVLPLLSTQ